MEGESQKLKLNLPAYDYQIKQEGDTLYIYDLLRKKYLVLTPEEWVRQHFLHYLQQEKGIPAKLIKQEASLAYHGLQKWADILVYDRSLQPLLLVECKASTESLTETVFNQILTYNAALQVPFLAVTNGLRHFYAHKEKEGDYQLIEELPGFGEMESDV